jgi:calcineurin-like phosphoesterase family protein
MVDLSKVINENTFVISDSHFGHFRVLFFEPIRVEYLADYNTDVVVECNELLDLLKTIPEDEHRDHPRINELGKFLIPFHDKMLYEKWNTVVGPNDTVLHLGDFAFRGIEEHTQKLNGNKILLRGNHDLKNGRTYTEAGWKDVIESVKIVVGTSTFEKTPRIDRYWNGLFMGIGEDTVLFSHYPIYNNCEWDVKKYGPITDMLTEIYEDIGGTLNIHGHTHTKLSDGDCCINVSIEHCTALTPMRIGDVIKQRV